MVNQDVAYLSESTVYCIRDWENPLGRWTSLCRSSGETTATANYAAKRDELLRHYRTAQGVIAAWGEDDNDHRMPAGLRYIEPA